MSRKQTKSGEKFQNRRNFLTNKYNSSCSLARSVDYELCAREFRKERERKLNQVTSQRLRF